MIASPSLINTNLWPTQEVLERDAELNRNIRHTILWRAAEANGSCPPCEPEQQFPLFPTRLTTPRKGLG